MDPILCRYESWETKAPGASARTQYGVPINTFSSTYLVGGAVRRCRPPCSSREGCSRWSPCVLLGGPYKIWPQGPDKPAGPRKQHRAIGLGPDADWLSTAMKEDLLVNQFEKAEDTFKSGIQKCPQECLKSVAGLSLVVRVTIAFYRPLVSSRDNNSIEGKKIWQRQRPRVVWKAQNRGCQISRVV